MEDPEQMCEILQINVMKTKIKTCLKCGYANLYIKLVI